MALGLQAVRELQIHRTRTERNRDQTPYTHPGCCSNMQYSTSTQGQHACTRHLGPSTQTRNTYERKPVCDKVLISVRVDAARKYHRHCRTCQLQNLPGWSAKQVHIKHTCQYADPGCKDIWHQEVGTSVSASTGAATGWQSNFETSGSWNTPLDSCMVFEDQTSSMLHCWGRDVFTYCLVMLSCWRC